MKDARIALVPDLVGRGAHERAVVLIVERRVGQLAAGPVDLDHAGGGHADVVGRVVERPLEVVPGRVGHDVAEDVHHLPLTHAVDDGLGVRADGRICKEKKGRENSNGVERE